MSKKNKRKSFPKVYIYALVDVREPDHYRYIGKTVDMENRFYSHLTDWKNKPLNKRTRKEKWIAKVWSEGSMVEMIEIKTIDCYDYEREKWEKWEIFYILFLKKRGHKLTNCPKCRGGEGFDSGEGNPMKDPEVLEKVSGKNHYQYGIKGEYAHLYGITPSQACMDAVKLWRQENNQSGSNNGFWGEHHTDEVKYFLRFLRIGTTQTQETKDKISAKVTGPLNAMYGSEFIWANNGKNNIRLGFEEELPKGFEIGMLRNSPDYTEELRKKYSCPGSSNPMSKENIERRYQEAIANGATEEEARYVGKNWVTEEEKERRRIEKLNCVKVDQSGQNNPSSKTNIEKRKQEKLASGISENQLIIDEMKAKKAKLRRLKRKHWINDGVMSKMWFKNEELPSGFVKGRLDAKSGSGKYMSKAA